MALTARARSGTFVPVVVLLVLLALPPLFGLSVRVQDTLVLALIYAAAAVGLDVFSGYAGQLTLGNFGFVGIGAYTSALLTSNLDWNVWATLPMAIVVAGIVAVLLGIPMIRLGELGGAFITFFFGFVVVTIFGLTALTGITGGHAGIAVEPLKIGGKFLDSDTLYYIAWGFLVIVALLSVRYVNSRAGRALRVIKRSPVVASALGIRVLRGKLASFVFSAMAAGGAGFIFAQFLGYLSPENFVGTLSLTLLLMAIVGGMGSIAGPIIGAVLVQLLNLTSREAGSQRELIYAAVLIIILIFFPEGVYGGLERIWAKLPKPWKKNNKKAQAAQTAAEERLDSVVNQTRDLSQPSTRPEPVEGESPILSLHDVQVAFGGVKALQGVTLDVREGDIHALMGPNGAGKTTILNCISGIQSFTGAVYFDGKPIHGLSPQDIRRRGLTRTFQNPSLVGDLTVLENVELGAAYSGERHGNVVTDLLPLPSTLQRDARSRERAEEALTMVGVDPSRWNQYASGLSLAEQKLTDIARALVSQPKLLLVDEPSSGLHKDEIDTVSLALRTINESSGVSVLVIAHQIGFLTGIAHAATVLDFGKPIADGRPKDVLAQSDVIDVFLGVEHIA